MAAPHKRKRGTKMKKARLSSNFKFSLESFTGRTDNLALAKRLRSLPRYVNGEQTEEIIGSILDIVNPENEEIFLPVKIVGEIPFTEKDIDHTNGTPVIFENITFTFYTNQKGYADLSVSAAGVKLAGK